MYRTHSYLAQYVDQAISTIVLLSLSASYPLTSVHKVAEKQLSTNIVSRSGGSPSVDYQIKVAAVRSSLPSCTQTRMHMRRVRFDNKRYIYITSKESYTRRSFYFGHQVKRFSSCRLGASVGSHLVSPIQNKLICFTRYLESS